MNIDDLINYCLTEMFRRVGATYSLDYCKQDRWYERFTWTEDEQSDYRKWLVGILRKKTRWNKVQVEREADWFMLDYGWKTKGGGNGK